MDALEDQPFIWLREQIGMHEALAIVDEEPSRGDACFQGSDSRRLECVAAGIVEFDSICHLAGHRFRYRSFHNDERAR